MLKSKSVFIANQISFFEKNLEVVWKKKTDLREHGGEEGVIMVVVFLTPVFQMFFWSNPRAILENGVYSYYYRGVCRTLSDI